MIPAHEPPLLQHQLMEQPQHEESPEHEERPHLEEQPNQGEECQPAEWLQIDHREQPQPDGQKEPEDPQPEEQLKSMQIQQSHPNQEN